MRQEVSLPNGSRADCLSDTHAIEVEVEFSEKWADGLGQALSYAGSTGLEPGIFLVCRKKPGTCLRRRLRLEEAIAAWSCRWTCGHDARTALYIAPYALDKAVMVHCREGLSIVEMNSWWLEMG